MEIGVAGLQAFPDLGLAKTPVCVRPHIQRPATVTQLPNCPNHKSKTVSTQPQREGSVCFCFGTRTRPVLLRGQAPDGLPSDSSLRISSDLDVPTEHSPSFSHPILCPPCHLPTWILHKQPNASVLMFMFQHQHSPPGQLRRRNQSGRENAMKNQSRKRTRGAKWPKPCDGTLANEFLRRSYRIRCHWTRFLGRSGCYRRSRCSGLYLPSHPETAESCHLPAVPFASGSGVPAVVGFRLSHTAP